MICCAAVNGFSAEILRNIVCSHSAWFIVGIIITIFCPESLSRLSRTSLIFMA